MRGAVHPVDSMMHLVVWDIDRERCPLTGMWSRSSSMVVYLRPTTAENFGIWLSGNVAGQTDTEPAPAAVVPFRARPSA